MTVVTNRLHQEDSTTEIIDAYKVMWMTSIVCLGKKKPFLETEGSNQIFIKSVKDACPFVSWQCTHLISSHYWTSWWKMEKRCKYYVTINITLRLNYVNQIDQSYVAVGLFINRSQKSGTWCAVGVNDLLSKFWRHLWSITGQTNSNMVCIC